jgi:hypothetical protein
MSMAGEALARLAETTRAGGTDFGLGIEARSRALVTAGQAADGWYADAIDRLGRTQLRTELARAHLLYGEWLRRENRRTDAREQLRTAYQMLDEIGMEGFAERARRELLASGETARKRTTRPAMACPTPRSGPGCSSAPTPSSTTWARSSPSSASAPAVSSTRRCSAARTLASLASAPARGGR